MDTDPYRPPAADATLSETPDLWTIAGGGLLVRDGASLPDVCIMGHHSGDSRHRASRDWIVAPQLTMRSPLRLAKLKKIRITSSETDYGVRRYKIATLFIILRIQAAWLLPSLACLGVLKWLIGNFEAWPVFAGLIVALSFLPWLLWNRRIVLNAGNGWYQIGVRPDTLEKLRAFRTEASGEAANSSA